MHGISHSKIRHHYLLRDRVVAHLSASRLGPVLCRSARQGEIGSFISGFINLNMGALVVAFHNVWHGIPVILTLLGYVWVLKSFIYFVFPRRGLKALARVSLERSWEFVVAGVVLLVVGGLLLWSLIPE
jgi:CDP-diglyceride synthetase